MSVSLRPESRLRHGCSIRYLSISPLHRTFHFPLPDSSEAVSDAMARLSRTLSRQTYSTACARFTPSDSGQRLPPTYYRSCWHVVSRGLSTTVTSKSLRYQQQPIHPVTQRFTTRGPSSLTRRRIVRVSPIAKYSRLQPPVGVWAVSQSQCG